MRDIIKMEKSKMLRAGGAMGNGSDIFENFAYMSCGAGRYSAFDRGFSSHLFGTDKQEERI